MEKLNMQTSIECPLNLIHLPEAGQWIATIRQKQGFSQKELSSMMGISENLAVDIENGRDTVKLENYLRYLSECGIQVLMINAGQKTPVRSESLPDLGKQIRQIRKAQHLTQFELTAMIGVSHTLALRIEKGNSKVKMKNWLTYLDALGIQLTMKSC